MREYLAQLIAESGTLTSQEIVLHIAASAVLSVAIYISYWYTHAGTAYSKNLMCPWCPSPSSRLLS